MCFTVEDRRNKGSITVEASIIVPIIILSISAVVYMGLLLYQRVLIQSAAEMAAEAGAAAWASGVSEIGTGKLAEDSFNRIKLYRRLYDSDSETRLECIESYAMSMASRNELLRPTETTAEAVVKDYAVCRKLELRIVKYYSLPLGNILKIFGGSGFIEINVKATSSIDEPVELVRTTDFILDLEKKLENNNPGIKNLGEKTRNAMNEIKSKLEQFID
jgi:hypothetical protein